MLHTNAADHVDADEITMGYDLKDLYLWISDAAFNPYEPMYIECCKGDPQDLEIVNAAPGAICLSASLSFL